MSIDLYILMYSVAKILRYIMNCFEELYYIKYKMQVLKLKIAKDGKSRYFDEEKCKKNLTFVHSQNKIDFISVK